MSRRRIQQVVALLFVLTLVLGVLSLGTGSTGQDEADPNTIEREIDPERCATALDEMQNFLADTFVEQTEAGAEPSDAVIDAGVADQAVWDTFFRQIATSCPDVGATLSELVVFTEAQSVALAGDPTAQLAALLTTAQICTIDVVQLTSDATAICVTAGDEATEVLNGLSGDTLGADGRLGRASSSGSD